MDYSRNGDHCRDKQGGQGASQVCPFRVGLWMIYKSGNRPATILPNEGIGVYACNLIKGLLAQEESVDYIVLCMSDDQRELASVLGDHPRLTFLTPPAPAPTWQEKRRQQIRAAAVRTREIVRRFVQKRSGTDHGFRVWFNRLIEQTTFKRKSSFASWGFRIFSSVLLLASIGIVYCLLVVLAGYCSLTVRMGCEFAKKTVRAMRRFRRSRYYAEAAGHSQAHLQSQIETIARQAGCNVWCIFSVNSEFPADIPSIYLLFDIIPAHFPRLFDSSTLAQVNFNILRNTSRATRVGCTSNVVRDNDLIKILRLPPYKVTVVRPASVTFSRDQVAEPTLDHPDVLQRPFIFYPTAVRPYKNIRNLILAINIVRCHYGLNDLDLVLTGPWAEKERKGCDNLIACLGLSEHVHILESVSFSRLADLYRRALATVVASMDEGLGLQINEALESGCPVACSRIPVFVEHCEGLNETVPFFDPQDPVDMARVIVELWNKRDQILARQQQAYLSSTKRSWDTVAREWLLQFRAAADRFVSGSHAAKYESDARIIEPMGLGSGAKPLCVYLMLPINCTGGVWESAKNLVRSLVEINRKKGRLRLAFGVDPDQSWLRDLDGVIVTDPLVLFHWVTKEEMRRLVPSEKLVSLMEARYSGQRMSVVSNLSAFVADAIFLLSDRMATPLVHNCPYGVIVHDLIQRHVPEAFCKEFFDYYREGIVPTVRHADVVVTTNPVTQSDVQSEIGNVHGPIRCIPVGAQPVGRFAKVIAEPVRLARTPFILNVNNVSPHKGSQLMLKGYRELLTKMGDDTPLLVMCGPGTEKFSRRYRGPAHPFWNQVQTVVSQLRLEEGRDVVFLGHVGDRQLLDLFQRCSLVVNSAKYDNGSFNLIEGNYFGKPLVSCRYPAAEWLYNRFGVPVHYCPIDDAKAMAASIGEALCDVAPSERELREIRERLSDPELGQERFAERMYDLLVELAEMKTRVQEVSSYDRRMDAA